MNVFSNVILARNRQLPDDDRMIETRRSIFKSFNINNLSVCIGWCADQANAIMLSERESRLSEVHKCLAWLFQHLTGLIWGHILDLYSPPPFHSRGFLSSWLSQITCSFRLQTLLLLSESLFAAYQPDWRVHPQEDLTLWRLTTYIWVVPHR